MALKVEGTLMDVEEIPTVAAKKDETGKEIRREQEAHVKAYVWCGKKETLAVKAPPAMLTPLTDMVGQKVGIPVTAFAYSLDNGSADIAYKMVIEDK